MNDKVSATVTQVAKRLGISQRRVRYLLTTGRMAGTRSNTGRWLVYWPLQVSAGKRGPDMTSYPARLILDKSE